MLDLLIESGAPAAARRRWVPSGLIAVGAHAAIAAGAVWATLAPARVGIAQPVPVIVWPDATGRAQTGAAPDEVPGLPETVVDVPAVPPVGLPPIDTGARIEPSRALRGVGGPGPAGDPASAPADWVSVEKPPTVLAGPPPAYPEPLRVAGIQGRVVVQAVIDTLGRAERGAGVVESSNRGFDAAALAYVRGALFRPGRVGGGRAVRVLIRLPIDFTLQGVR
jgi:TonB family protein